METDQVERVCMSGNLDLLNLERSHFLQLGTIAFSIVGSCALKLVLENSATKPSSSFVNFLASSKQGENQPEEKRRCKWCVKKFRYACKVTFARLTQ